MRKPYKGNAFLLVLDNNEYEETPRIYVACVLLAFARNKYVFPLYMQIDYIHTPNFELLWLFS
jgi:hypothetical protein